MRTRKMGTCQPDKLRWSVGQRPTNTGTRTSFHGGLSSPQSNAFRFVSGTPGCWHSWVQMFPVPLEKVVGAAEWAALVPFSESCSLSGTGTGDSILLQISISQRVDHCDVSLSIACGVVSRISFLISSFIKIGWKMWELWLVEILAFPLTWHIAYTTACCYRTSCDGNIWWCNRNLSENLTILGVAFEKR